MPFSILSRLPIGANPAAPLGRPPSSVVLSECVPTWSPIERRVLGSAFWGSEPVPYDGRGLASSGRVLADGTIGYRKRLRRKKLGAMTEAQTRVSDWSPLAPDEDMSYAQTFTDLRQKCPVAWTEDFGGFWSLLKHDDITSACKRPGTFSSAPQFTVPHLDLGFPWLPLQSDPPDHQNYKAPLLPLLAKSKVTELVPRLREIAISLIEPLRDLESFDASRDFAQPFAGEALCLALRVPESMWAEFRSWTSSIVQAMTEGNLQLLLDVSNAVADYVTRESAARTENPGDDLMSALLQARVNGQSLTCS